MASSALFRRYSLAYFGRDAAHARLRSSQPDTAWKNSMHSKRTTSQSQQVIGHPEAYHPLDQSWRFEPIPELAYAAVID